MTHLYQLKQQFSIMIRIKSIFFVLLFSSLFFLGCSPKLEVALYHQSDKEVDATQYHTFEYYGWADNSAQVLTSMDKKLIENAFAKEFTNRDLKYVESGGDLIVSLYLVTAEVQETKATTVYNGSGYGYGGYGGAGYNGYSYSSYGYGNYYGYGPGYGWGAGMSTSTVYTNVTVDEGTLIMNIFDAKQKLLIYETVAIKKMDGQLRGDQRLTELVARSMMYNFQVPVVKKK